MTIVERSALVNYSAEQMFTLINDIAAYPSFMAGCVAAEVLTSSEQFIEARLTLGKGGIEQSFVTRNELLPPEQMIMRLVEGPFSYFEGRWSFQSLADNACKVQLHLEFSFKNPLLGLAVSKWLEDIASRQVESLCQRAEKIYG
jgi:ribosome-associated toxin RatA of RatAB toxin-antitoxin module